MKLSYSAREGVVAVSISFCAAFCSGQSFPQTEASDPAQSSQSPTPSSSRQDKPGDQPPAQSNSQDKKNLAQEDPKKAADPKKKDDRMFYVMPTHLTVDDQAQVPPVSWKEKFAMAAEGSFDPYEFTLVGIMAGIRQARQNNPEERRHWAWTLFRCPSRTLSKRAGQRMENPLCQTHPRPASHPDRPITPMTSLANNRREFLGSSPITGRSAVTSAEFQG